MMQEKYQTYSIVYPYKGQIWGFDIKATSQEDAQARLNALKNWASYDGEIVAKIYVPGGTTIYKVWQAIKSFFAR